MSKREPENPSALPVEDEIRALLGMDPVGAKHDSIVDRRVQERADQALEEILGLPREAPHQSRGSIKVRVAVALAGVAAATVVGVAVWPDEEQSTQPPGAALALPSFEHGDPVGGGDSFAAASGLIPRIPAEGGPRSPMDMSPAFHLVTIAWHQGDGKSETAVRTEVQAPLNGASIGASSRIPIPETGLGIPIPTKAGDPRPILVGETVPADAWKVMPGAIVRAWAAHEAECTQPSFCILESAADAHERWFVPQAVDLRMWRTLATDEGTTFLGATRDRLGRPAVAIAVESAEGDQTLVAYADATTWHFVGLDWVDTSGQRPRVESFMAVEFSEKRSG